MLKLADYIALSFLALLAIIITSLHSEIKEWYLLLLLNTFYILLCYYVITKYEKLALINDEKLISRRNPLKAFRYFYGVPFILISFKEVYHIIFALKWNDIDLTLIGIDKAMFGLNPTEWIYRFENPLLTELLQIIYFLYYVLILAWGLELYIGKKYKEYKYTIFFLFSLFAVWYILYMLLPAAGPRFYIHNFFVTNKELPGLFFTIPIREFLNSAESIPNGASNPLFYVQRDAMPSLHTGAAVLIVYLSYHFKSKSFYVYFPYCILMIISTIYLRYHYVVDAIAGIVLTVVMIVICRAIYKKYPSLVN